MTPHLRTFRRCGFASARLLVAIAVVAALAGPADAQTPQDGNGGWWRAWSPLAPVADLVSPAAPTVRMSHLLVAPAPRAGLAWTAGNPAGLPQDARKPYTAFRAGLFGEDGAYARPLDPGSVRSTVASAQGWRPLGTSGGVVGSVTVARTSLADGAPADLAEPYGMSPHLFADSSGADVGRTLARLEGAGGWRIGPWSSGFALGHQSWDTRTDVSQVPRSQRGSRSGASAGLSWALLDGALVLATSARWPSQVEAMSVSTRQAQTSVYLVSGYGEPVVLALAERQGYARRAEREGGAAGVSAQLERAGARWVAFAEASKLGERQTEQASNDPPADRWDAQGWRAGVAMERVPGEGRAGLVAGASWARVSGDAMRAGLQEEGTVFDASESALEAWLDLRLQADGGWRAGLRASVVRDERDRHDRLARVGSSLRSWRPEMAVEGALDVGRSFTIGVGGGVAWHTPEGGIPDPTSLGHRYGAWVGRGLSYEATPSRAASGSVTLAWNRAEGERLAVDVDYGRAMPRDTDVTLPLAPEGRRTRWDLSMSWVW